MGSKTVLPDGTVIAEDAGTRYHADGRTGPRDPDGRPLVGPDADAAAPADDTHTAGKQTRRKRRDEERADAAPAREDTTDPTSTEETRT
jgi:hypothetical protein